MPLRDHFRPPLDEMRHWEGLHATWPVMMVASLRRQLPRGYFAEPRVHLGTSVEVDVATFEGEREGTPASTSGGGVATAVWAPARPTLDVVTDLPAQDVYEVRVYDQKRPARLVAAVEIVSPANKDRPENRRVFATKCAALLREQVSIAIVDVVTTRTQNLYAELLDLIGSSDPTLSVQAPLLYANACKLTRRDEQWRLQAWTHELCLGQSLPTLPLWLADDLAIPLALEDSYEQSCAILDIP